MTTGSVIVDREAIDATILKSSFSELSEASSTQCFKPFQKPESLSKSFKYRQPISDLYGAILPIVMRAPHAKANSVHLADCPTF